MKLYVSIDCEVRHLKFQIKRMGLHVFSCYELYPIFRYYSELWNSDMEL